MTETNLMLFNAQGPGDGARGAIAEGEGLGQSILYLLSPIMGTLRAQGPKGPNIASFKSLGHIAL